MLSSSLDGVSASTHFAQHLFMSFQFPICGVIDGDSLFQQIENHLADSIDLIGVGVCQHVLTLVSIGFFQDALQKGALSSQPLHRRFLCPVGKTASYMMSHDAASAWISCPVPFSSMEGFFIFSFVGVWLLPGLFWLQTQRHRRLLPKPRLSLQL